ncbi:MAG: discoidin domain-containing protein [Bacteroidota bacterium]
MIRTSIFTLTALSLLMLFVSQTRAQETYTSYDEIPGLDKSLKPAFDSSYPPWARMLYQEPVHVDELDRAYRTYMEDHQGEKSPVIRYYKLWRKAVDPYVMSDGTVALPDMEKMNRELLDFQLRVKPGQPYIAKSTGANWSFLGPKNTYWLNSDNFPVAPRAYPWQVNVYSFDVCDADNQVIYCGTESGIVNKTTDRGFQWEQKGIHYVFGGGISAVAVHPYSPDTVYVSAGNNIHKSEDGGESWTPLLPVGGQFGANRLKIDINHPEKLVASSGDGVFISENGGESWSNPLTYKSWDVEIKPGDSQTLYTISNWDGKYRIFTSEDGGASFGEITSFPGASIHSGAMLAVTPANPDLLFAILLTSDSDHSPYLFKGVLDAGSWTWTRIATGKTGALEMDNGQGYFDLVLELSPLDENLIFVGTTTLYKSDNGGASFGPVGGYSGKFRIHPDIQDMQILPSGITWVATDGGMTRSEDYYSSVYNYECRNNGVVGSTFWGFDQGWNEDIVVGGRYHNGNTAMADFYNGKALRMGGAESPTGWVIHGKSRHVAFSDIGAKILPATAEGKPGGTFQFAKYPNMPFYGGYRGNLLHHPNYYDMIYVGESNGFWKSSDMGSSFDMIYEFPDEVLYMEISFSDPEIIYADVVNHGLYKTEDGGYSWTAKPSITDWSHGGASLAGNIFIAVSPGNGNVLYVGHTNSPGSNYVGSIFRSEDGGDSWTDISGSMAGYLESIVIQPDEFGNDLLYTFMNSANITDARCYFKRISMPDWKDYSTGLLAGMSFNRAMPFYRDSKLRAAGTASVWESPMAVTDYKPLINPWVGRPVYADAEDTLRFDDHSILNHEGASWEWILSPEPAFISDPHARNPRVVTGSPGDYSVTLRVTKNGNVYEKTIPDMVHIEAPPSLFNCSEPAEIPQETWTLQYADSEETDYADYSATYAFDGDNSTFWHTEWSLSTPGHPHEIQVEFDTLYNIHGFSYLPRQDMSSGHIENYEIYMSEDAIEWGDPVASGTFPAGSDIRQVGWDEQVTARFARLVARSSIDGDAYTSVAELTFTGCYTNMPGNRADMVSLGQQLPAFPVPATELVHIPLPKRGSYRYAVVSVSGRIMDEGVIEKENDSYTLQLGAYPAGLYFVNMSDKGGVHYRVKLIKQ